MKYAAVLSSVAFAVAAHAQGANQQTTTGVTDTIVIGPNTNNTLTVRPVETVIIGDCNGAAWKHLSRAASDSLSSKDNPLHTALSSSNSVALTVQDASVEPKHIVLKCTSPLIPNFQPASSPATIIGQEKYLEAAAACKDWQGNLNERCLGSYGLSRYDFPRK